jgi:hypothetical protein
MWSYIRFLKKCSKPPTSDIYIYMVNYRRYIMVIFRRYNGDFLGTIMVIQMGKLWENIYGISHFFPWLDGLN